MLAIETALSLKVVVFADQMASILAELISGGPIDHLIQGIFIVLLRFIAAVDTLLADFLELVVEWVVFTIGNHVEL